MSSNGIDTNLLVVHETRISKLETDTAGLSATTAVLGSRLTSIDNSLDKMVNTLEKQSVSLFDISTKTAILQAKNDWKQWVESNWWVLIAACAPVIFEVIFHLILKK